MIKSLAADSSDKYGVMVARSETGASIWRTDAAPPCARPRALPPPSAHSYPPSHSYPPPSMIGLGLHIWMAICAVLCTFILYMYICDEYSYARCVYLLVIKPYYNMLGVLIMSDYNINYTMQSVLII